MAFFVGNFFFMVGGGIIKYIWAISNFKCATVRLLEI